MSERTAERTWPVLSGALPPLAEGFNARPETGQGPWDGLHQGLTVILGPDSDARTSPTFSGRRGGTGKTQLAAAFATRLWTAGELDLLVWVSAGSRDSIVTSYAQALTDIKVAAPPGQPEAAAAQFLSWLAETGRRWLVVLDGLVESADADELWPHGPGGELLVTTVVSGLIPAPGQERVTIAVTAFSEREALNYMSARLSGDPYHSAGSLDLALTIDCLPVGIGLALAYLLDSGQDCRQYRLACERYRQRWQDNPAGDALAPLWMFAVDRAMQFAPVELAWPALKLAVVLAAAGIPGAVLTAAAACAYVTGKPSVTTSDQASLRSAYGNLERSGLVRIDPDDDNRTVTISAALQSSVRQAMSRRELRQAAEAAADAVYEAWPERAAPAQLEQALRDCATSIRRCDGLALWDRGCHPLLPRIGRSLDDARLTDIALHYWRDLARRSADYVGPRTPVTLQLRERVASAAVAAGRTEEAIGLRLELAADLDEVAGPAHPEAVAARARLAQALRAANRLPDAISLGKRVSSDCELVFGPAHSQTIESLRELGCAYRDADRHPEAVDMFRRCLSLREQAFGTMHRDTVAARHDLADACRRADRPREAIKLYSEAVTQSEATVGTIHPDTFTARQDLALAYYDAGRTDEAATTFERAIADWQRGPGGTHPQGTVTARASLAAIYFLGGRLKEAIRLLEAEIADLDRVRDPGHADTLRARWNLAAAYHKAKRAPEAIALGEATLADCEQYLGPGHWETLTTRANLAHAYHTTGLLKRASAQFDRALRDCARALGPGDPLTDQVRALRKRYLAGRQGAAPIIAAPGLRRLPHCRPGRRPGRRHGQRSASRPPHSASGRIAHPLLGRALA